MSALFWRSIHELPDSLHDYPVDKLMLRKLNAAMPSSATEWTAVLEGCSHSSGWM